MGVLGNGIEVVKPSASFETTHITISENENSHLTIKQEPPIDRNLSDPLEINDAGEYLLQKNIYIPMSCTNCGR